MKSSVQEIVAIPDGISCEVSHKSFVCKKGNDSVTKAFNKPGLVMKINGKNVEISNAKANKKDTAVVKSAVAHVKNMFRGLEKHYVYHMEICNVHFPMTVKHEGNKLIINNFLGEKEKRFATIVAGVKLEIKGQQLVLSGADVEAVGQSAANIEKATWVTHRDRRVFQDGIFITSKDGEDI
jgi:large subunit ribosomal protein L6